MAQNTNKMLIIGLVFVTVGISAIFAGLKIFSPEQSKITKETPAFEPDKTTAFEPEITAPVEQEKSPEPAELTQEDIDFFRKLDELAAKETAEQESHAEEEVYVQNDLDYSETVTFEETSSNQKQEQTSNSMPRWRQIWTDLDLTEDEKGRLRQGFMLLLQKWGAMSPEDQMAERLKMESMRTQWENMSEEERNDASQRIRDSFDEWRQSGSIELPELSLD